MEGPKWRDENVGCVTCGAMHSVGPKRIFRPKADTATIER